MAEDKIDLICLVCGMKAATTIAVYAELDGKMGNCPQCGEILSSRVDTQWVVEETRRMRDEYESVNKSLVRKLINDKTRYIAIINHLANIIIDIDGKNYVSGNELDEANDAIDMCVKSDVLGLSMLPEEE